MGDVVAGDVEGLAAVGDAPDDDVRMRVAGVVMIDRDPVEPSTEVGFHLPHQIAGSLPQVGQLHTVFGRDDEAELVAVLATAVEKGAAVRHVALGRIDLALLAVPRDAVALQVAQVRVDRLGADELPAARRAALRVELHDARLNRDPARAGASPTVPAPGAAVLERRRHRRATAARVEAATTLPPPGIARPIRVAAGPSDRLMDLANKAGGAGAHGTDTTAGRAHASTVTDLARSDAKVVVVAGHATTIGGRGKACKRRVAAVILWRRKTCGSVGSPGRTSRRRRSAP